MFVALPTALCIDDDVGWLVIGDSALDTGVLVGKVIVIAVVVIHAGNSHVQLAGMLEQSCKTKRQRTSQTRAFWTHQTVVVADRPLQFAAISTNQMLVMVSLVAYQTLNGPCGKRGIAPVNRFLLKPLQK